MLLAYERYLELGGTLTLTEYPAYEMFAESDLKTFASGNLPDSGIVETCMMIMINAYVKADEISMNGAKTSYSNDGLSVSYSQSESSSEITNTALSRVKSIFAANGIKPKSLAVIHRA